LNAPLAASGACLVTAVSERRRSVKIVADVSISES
jgi:hypothetical protein